VSKPISELTLRELIEQNRLKTEVRPAPSAVLDAGSRIQLRVAVSWRDFPPDHSC